MANVDPTFMINDFNKPKILSEDRTLVQNILSLLFGKPGFYPSIPNLGMDISQYLYTYEDEINIPQITSKLAEQCSDFLPDVLAGNINISQTVYEGNKMLVIQLPVIDDERESIYAIAITTDDTGQIKYNYANQKL